MCEEKVAPFKVVIQIQQRTEKEKIWLKLDKRFSESGQGSTFSAKGKPEKVWNLFFVYPQFKTYINLMFES